MANHSQMKQKDIKELIIVGLVAGAIVSVTYPLQITNRFSRLGQTLMEITMGPLIIIGSLALYFFIRQQRDTVYNILGLIFNVLAGLSVTMMLVVQGAVFTMIRDFREATDELNKQIIKQSFRSGNLTQLGMDITFDVFISLGTVFIALALLKQNRIKKWLSIPGLIVGLGGLSINIATFPIPPADQQLFDPGPFYGIYFGILLIAIFLETLKEHRKMKSHL